MEVYPCLDQQNRPWPETLLIGALWYVVSSYENPPSLWSGHLHRSECHLISQLLQSLHGSPLDVSRLQFIKIVSS